MACACAAGIIQDGGGAPTGTPLSDPPLVEMISEDPVLRSTKLIAEAWDCDGLFQVRRPGIACTCQHLASSNAGTLPLGQAQHACFS